MTTATSKSPLSAKDEQELMSHIWDPQIADNPLAFVKFVWPWGQPGTPLADHEGPRTWQCDKLLEIGEVVARNRNVEAQNKARKRKDRLPYEMMMDATASGRGPGKSALVAWLIWWMKSTRLGSSTIITANTEQQLKSRTWAELGKWHTMAVNAHWFDRSALLMRPAPWFEKALKHQLKVDTGYYYAQAQLWSEENPDAFAGVHNHNGIMVIFDEGSGVPAPIWKVTEGFFTEPIPDRYWFVFSNPRRNTGAFFECFHKDRNFWRRLNLDSRTVEGTDHAVLQRIVDKYGEDSDEARVEVKGQFPRQGDKQFIGRDVIENAQTRDIVEDNHAALMMGVDVARYGDDKTVIRFRRGRDARSIPPVEMKGADNMQVAYKCAELIQKYNPDGVCVDAGNGTGVIDRLKEMGYRIHEVWFGGKSDEPEWVNKRTQMWANLREWLNGGCIDDSGELADDLAGPEYKFQGAGDKIMLEAKEEMKKRGLASPDHGDALACTFAVKVARRDIRASRHFTGRSRMARDVDYAIFG